MAVRTISARFAGTCGDCDGAIAVGDQILYGGRGRVAHANGTCTLDNVAAGPTTRERKLAKAERLRGWADGRAEKAAALHARNEPYRGDIAFNTQPGHIPERARAIARTERAWEHSAIAVDMARRADGIEAAADRAIYSDDPDAIDQLIARVAELEAKRDRMKIRNATFRKEHRADLKGKSAYERDQLVPHSGWEVTNLTANIARNRKRLEALQREAQ